MKLENIKDAVLIWGAVSEQALYELKREKVVLVSENRPYLIGLKYNIPLLRNENIGYLYCTDNVLGFLFYKSRIKKTFIFYKDKKEEGVVGICGSLYVYLLSKLHSVPVEALAQGEGVFSGVDRDAASLGGRDFIMQEDSSAYVVKACDEILPLEVLR